MFDTHRPDSEPPAPLILSPVRSKEERPILDPSHPLYELHCDGCIGFIRWPLYTLGEFCFITGLKRDRATRLLRSGRYGAIAETPDAVRPGKRKKHQSIFVPFSTLLNYLERVVKLPEHYRGSRDVGHRRFQLEQSGARRRDKHSNDKG